MPFDNIGENWPVLHVLEVDDDAVVAIRVRVLFEQWPGHQQLKVHTDPQFQHKTVHEKYGVCELKTSLTTSNNNTNSKNSRRDTAKTSHKPRVSSSKPARRPKFLLSKTRRRRRDFTFTRRVRIRPTPLNNCDERSEHVHRQFMDEYFELVVVVGGARVVVPPLSHSRAS